MKQVMKILGAAVGFLFTSAVIILSVTYFNRGKEVVTNNAEGILSIIENSDMGGINMESYNGMNVPGSIVISMIESLSTNASSVPVLVYTSGGTTVSEYTSTGATTNLTMANLTTGIYAMTKVPPDTDGVTALNGEYKQKNNRAYINPTQTYSVRCHYTQNEALAFVSIVHNATTDKND